MRANPQSCRKFRNRHTRSPNELSILGLLKATSNKDFAEQVAQSNIPPSLERQVDAPLDKLALARGHGPVETDQVTFADAI